MRLHMAAQTARPLPCIGSILCSTLLGEHALAGSAWHGKERAFHPRIKLNEQCGPITGAIMAMQPVWIKGNCQQTHSARLP
jgi:hypothetical protein